MTDSDPVKVAAERLAPAYEKWMSMHFDEDDAGLARFLAADPGFRAAVEKIASLAKTGDEGAQIIMLQLVYDGKENDEPGQNGENPKQPTQGTTSAGSVEAVRGGSNLSLRAAAAEAVG